MHLPLLRPFGLPLSGRSKGIFFFEELFHIGQEEHAKDREYSRDQHPCLEPHLFRRQGQSIAKQFCPLRQGDIVNHDSQHLGGHRSAEIPAGGHEP